MTEYASPAPPPADALLVRLARLRDRVAELVASRSAADPTASDPLRGLYLSVEAVQHLLGPTAVSHTCVFDDATGFEATDLESAPAARLERLAVRLGLTELDTRILLIALAPTWTAPSSRCTDTSTTTSAGAGPPPGWRSTCAGCPCTSPRRGPGSTPRHR